MRYWLFSNVQRCKHNFFLLALPVIGAKRPKILLLKSLPVATCRNQHWIIMTTTAAALAARRNPRVFRSTYEKKKMAQEVTLKLFWVICHAFALNYSLETNIKTAARAERERHRDENHMSANEVMSNQMRLNEMKSRRFAGCNTTDTNPEFHHSNNFIEIRCSHWN